MIATPITLTADERQTLERWISASTTEQRLVLRSRIILAAADGRSTTGIAHALRVRPATASKWRTRFARDRIAGLQDAPRSGMPPKYDASTERRILRQLDEKPPEGFAQWNGSLLAKELGISDDHVWRVLRKHAIQLQRRHAWCISTDPEFARKAADIVGLYIDPPENAVVISVDEKPHIQALERAQGYLKLPNGKAITGYNHEYKRNGTSTLFAAFEIATGAVKAGHYNRRRRREFLDFMNDVVSGYSKTQELHVVLDNLNTHKPKHDQWLARHKNVHFHYTPTHASWLNQVECWFSILSRNALKGASFQSVHQLRKAMDSFIEAYNKTAAPFEWRKTVVHPVSPKRRYADLCK